MIRLALLLCMVAPPVLAQDADRKPSHCLSIAQSAPGLDYVRKASFRDPVAQDRVRLHYIAHASFLIQAHGGTDAITDFTGFVGNVDFLPDVVTMNHAHETHWTPFPDPAIPHVLQGWGDVHGEGIDHYLDLGDMVVRNVSTDIRPRYGAEAEAGGNSIFVFETAGLCIGHLGHLHHMPTDEQFAALGRVDVLLAPVDGGYTLPLPRMIETVKRLRSSIVIPMHWFGDGTLQVFLDAMEEEFSVVRTEDSALTVSLDTLPGQPTVMVLRPRWLSDPG
ncbi:MAG: MBL fold metallo-hydrolase [Roseovarius sp.]